VEPPDGEPFDAEKQPPKHPPGSAAPAMAPALGRPAERHRRLRCHAAPRLRPAARPSACCTSRRSSTRRRPGTSRRRRCASRGARRTSSFYRNARAGGFGAPYESTDFDVLFVHAGQASAEAVGCFVIPVSDLVARLHVLGAFERRGKTYACDASTVANGTASDGPDRTPAAGAASAPEGETSAGRRRSGRAAASSSTRAARGRWTTSWRTPPRRTTSRARWTR
jgi:hypothetical protein